MDGNNSVLRKEHRTTSVNEAKQVPLNVVVLTYNEALNLTDEVDDQWVDDAGNRLTYYHETGRQYYLGVQYKY